jgi:hypothetical protein
MAEKQEKGILKNTQANPDLIMRIKNAIDESGKLQKGIAEEMCIGESALCRDITDGILANDGKKLFSFVKATRSEDLLRYALTEMGFANYGAKFDAPSEPQEILHLRDENLMLKKELEEHKKLLSEVGVDLKKNLDHLTDFVFKKALGT